MKSTNLHPVVQNLLKIQKDRKLTKVAFAEVLGIQESKWNKISNGNQDVSLSELSDFARVLGMREIDLYTYPQIFEDKMEVQPERISVTFEVSPDKRDILLSLVTKNN